jgi:predicted AAA+ superfamily ATPase
LVLHELRSQIGIGNIGGELSYWRTPSGSEVDFIWSRGRSVVGIEVKANKTWRTEYGSVLHELVEDGLIQAGIGVYLGKERLRSGRLEILPLRDFMEELASGSLLSPA